MKTKRRKATVPRVKRKTARVSVNVSVTQHRKLKKIAALKGVSLQEYIRSKILTDSQEEGALDHEVESIAKGIIEENMDALKRLADK